VDEQHPAVLPKASFGGTPHVKPRVRTGVRQRERHLSGTGAGTASPGNPMKAG